MTLSTMTTEAGIAGNLGLIAAVALCYRPLVIAVRPWPAVWLSLAKGLLFGGAAVGCMLLAYEVQPGVMLDQRGMALALAGLLGGPLTACLAAVIAGAYRLWLGGDGALGGTISIIGAVGLGMALRAALSWRGGSVEWRHLLLLAVMVVLATIAALGLTPATSLGWSDLAERALPCSAMTAAGILMVGSFLLAEERRIMLEQQLRALNDNLPGVLYQRTMSGDGRSHITYVSPNVRRLFGLRVDRIMEAPDTLTDRVMAEDRPRLAEAYRRSATDLSPLDLDVRASRANSGLRWIRVSARPVRAADGTISWHGLLRDVTERHEQQEQLEAARFDAECANRAKSDFLAGMSHELRTPLNAIIGFSELLLLERGQSLSDGQRDYVQHVLRAGTHLLRLITDVLDLSKVEAGQLRVVMESIDTEEILHEVRSALAPIAQRTGLVVSVRAGPDVPPVRADRGRLTQILLNFGSNAVKYNRPGGRIVLETLSADRPGFVRLAVTDTGPGIPPERQTELFKPFSRLGAETSAIEGTGIGLAIAKQLTALMGGQIGVWSEPGVGSRFWVDLPLATAAGAPGPKVGVHAA